MQPAFVVFTDFSAAAERALRYTTPLARALNGRLVLLHVYQDPYIEPEAAMMTVPLVLENRKERLAQLTERARQLALPAEAELSVEALADAMADVVQRHQPLMLGHQAAPILQAARYPLLLVPESWPTDQPPRRLVVAADEHGFWLTPASLALQGLLAGWHAPTTVVHVGPAHGASRAVIGFEAVRRTGLFGPLTDNDLYEVREEAPADGVLHAVAELQADLLVVLARPHTFLGELFHRSVTGQLLRRSPVPVLVLPTMH
jgi:nucleotide-binding universal stress UspA family protein